MSNDRKHKVDRPIWLTSLADADHETLPHVSIESRLQSALRRRRHVILGKRLGSGLLAASLAAVVWFQASTSSLVKDAELLDDNVSEAIMEAMNFEGGSDDADFIPTKFASEQPLEAVRVVRVSMPTGALAKYGVSAVDSSGEVTADLMVGQDGMARAIRVVK